MIRKLLWALIAAALAAALGSAGAQGAFTVFFEAVQRGDRPEVEKYLKRGMDPNSVDAEGTPALVLAARAKAWDVVDALSSHRRADVNARSPSGETALMVAAFVGRLDVMRALLERGAEVNAKGWTALHYAATSGHVEAIELLLERSAYIDAESPNRTTPLMMAARHQQMDALRLLVERGADPTLRNASGYSAADYLWANGMNEMAAWMRARAEAFDARYRRGIK